MNFGLWTSNLKAKQKLNAGTNCMDKTEQATETVDDQPKAKRRMTLKKVQLLMPALNADDQAKNSWFLATFHKYF